MRLAILKDTPTMVELGYSDFALAAQTHAVSFYEGLGYQPHGAVFLEAGLQHQEMRLRFE